jgi:hypothetical protein
MSDQQWAKAAVSLMIERVMTLVRLEYLRLANEVRR